MSLLSRWLLVVAALLLAAMAVLHYTGYAQLAGVLSAREVPPAWADALLGLWLWFSIVLAVLAIFLCSAAMRPEWAVSSVLVLCMVLATSISIVLFAFVGVFVGSILITVAAVLMFIAWLRRRPFQGVVARP
ncbi:MAG: hypothetical protein ACREQ3_10830 [Candidatus Binatia bacterium]